MPVAIAGFAFSGIGLAAIMPFVFSAAGQQGNNALVGVATLSYSGWLAGPPAVGFIAESMGLQMGMAFIALLGVAVAIAASIAKALE